MWFLPFAFQIIFLETICNDKDVLERNIRLKVQQSPDHAEQWEITYLLSYAHPIGALLYAIVIFYVTGQILKLVCGISKNDWPIMKRSIITEYIEKIPLMSLQISYIPQPIAKLLICCMPSVCKTPPLRAILDRSDVWKRVLYSCHSFSIPCLLSSLPEFIYDPDMLLFLSKIQNTCTNPTQLLMPVASISSYFGAPSEFGPRCPVELLQETGADGMLREMRGVWLDLEDKGILVI